jgi:hypothetical protein
MTETPGSGLSRRQMLESLAAAVSAGFVIPGTAAAHPVQEHLKDPVKVAEARGPAAPSFLAPRELETFSSLAEQIIPGATKAGVGSFVSALLAVGSKDQAESFLTTLGALDGACVARYNHPWTALTPAQQVEFLTAASQGPRSEEPQYWTPGTPLPMPERPDVAPTLRDSFEEMRGWAAGAYYSSEVGLRDIGWTGNLFFQSFPGCAHAGEHA